MATVKPGGIGPIRGKTGNTTRYDLNGKQIVRGIGGPGPATPKRLMIRQRTRLLQEVFSPLDAFIRVGFDKCLKEWCWTFHNVAMNLNNPDSISGIYPDQFVDYSKLILSKGNLPGVKHPEVKLIDNSLVFSWENNTEEDGADEDDQVMVAVYFPEMEKAMTVQSGTTRKSGRYQLQLTSHVENRVMEIFMAFNAEDRRDVSDSVYVGNLMWTANTGNHGEA